jgi:hypothetical protein
MQFSSGLPYGVRAVREFIVSGQSLHMNVNAEADRAFCLALEKKRREILRAPCSGISIGCGKWRKRQSTKLRLQQAGTLIRVHPAAHPGHPQWSKYSSRSLPSATTHRSAPVDDKSAREVFCQGRFPASLCAGRRRNVAPSTQAVQIIIALLRQISGQSPLRSRTGAKAANSSRRPRRRRLWSLLFRSSSWLDRSSHRRRFLRPNSDG